MKKLLIIIGLCFVLIAGYAVGEYNSLTSFKLEAETSWSTVETYMQRRYDLIPNVVATVRKYSDHEEKVFTEIANARAKMAGAKTKEDTMEANSELSSAISRLLMITENYPQLKANEQYQSLINELEGTENRLAQTRKAYNKSVLAYNKHVQTFPGNIFANMYGFTPMEQFKAEENAKEAPKVNFD